MATTDQAGRPATPATRPASTAMRLADMAGAMRLGRELIGHDHWTAEELAAHQRQRLEELVGHAMASSPFYRERYAGLGLEQGGAVELGRLPTVDKATVMDRFDDLVTDRRLTLAASRPTWTAWPATSCWLAATGPWPPAAAPAARGCSWPTGPSGGSTWPASSAGTTTSA